MKHLEFKEILELSDKKINRLYFIIITVFYYLKIDREDNFTKLQSEFLEIKTTMAEMSNILSGIKSRLDSLKERFMNLKI